MIVTSQLHSCVTAMTIILQYFFCFHIHLTLIQLLDIGVFSPLKAAMKAELNALFRTGIACLHKSQWIEKYVKAREKAITKKNILAGWRGSGLWPINRVRILSQIPEPDTTSTPPPNQPISNTLELLTSSPPDALVLYSTNIVLNTKIAAAPDKTPIRTHIHRLSGIAEQLHAENAILRKDNAEIRAALSARKERESGKRKIIKGISLVTTEEVIAAVEKAEITSKKRKKKQIQRKRKTADSEESYASEVEQDHNEETRLLSQEGEVFECIVVEDN